MTINILFTRSTRILPDLKPFADLPFYIWIDRERLITPFKRMEPYKGAATYQFFLELYSIRRF